MVEEGEDQVVLECPFTFTQEEESEDQLELKWYFNDSPAPFYQERQRLIAFWGKLCIIKSPVREKGAFLDLSDYLELRR